MATSKSRRNPPRGQPPQASTESEEPIGERFARTTAPRQLDDGARRQKWRLPLVGDNTTAGPHIVELNALHGEGLAGAARAFIDLHGQVMASLPQATRSFDRPDDGPCLEPSRIGKSYYRCDLTDAQRRKLVAVDESRSLQERTIYRLWPDFPVKPHTDRSTPTITADAALRSFDAAGDKITWAVICPGVDATHAHILRRAGAAAGSVISLQAPAGRRVPA